MTCLIILALLFPALTYAQIPERAKQYQRDLTRNARSVWGLNAPVATFAAQIHQESAWNETARSPVGARGLAQFMPATADWISNLYGGDLMSANSLSPAWALRALVQYDHWLWDRIAAADDCQRMAFTLSAYNGGLGYVYKRQRQSSPPYRCFDAACDINPGIHPKNQIENSRYPKLILLKYEPLYVKALWGPGKCG